MKFQTTRNDLLDKIIFASKTTTPKSTIFVLGGIMLDVDEILNIYSTDLENSINITSKVNVIKKGRVVVPVKILINILKSFPEAKIELELLTQTNQLKITCQNAVLTINTYSIEEYPKFPKIKKENPFFININKFKNLISKTLISTSVDENRTILTGVLMEIEGNKLKMAATDSYRLSFIESEINFKKGSIKVVVPYKTLDTILKTEAVDGKIEINIEENQISFILEKENNTKTIIISRLLSGKFPEYNKLIPSKLKHTIVVDKEKILGVIKRVSSISQDNVPIKLKIANGKITVFMSIKEIGNASEDIEVGYAEEEMEIAFNPAFLIEGINIIKDKNLLFCINDPLKPVLLKPEKNENLIYLLMPIRIS